MKHAQARKQTSTSKQVTSSQQGIHHRLEATVTRHINSSFRKPYAEHNLRAFRQAEQFINRQNTSNIILDSGCGTGESTLNIAREHPEACVIGIDRSEARLSRKLDIREHEAGNYLLIRAQLEDLWRLFTTAAITLHKHFLLYPNPYPKPGQLQRRWHASPLFPHLLQLGGILECRSNWLIYIQELDHALALSGVNGEIRKLEARDICPISAFEKKYLASGHAIYQLQGKIDQR